MTDEIAISAHNLSKIYKLYDSNKDRIKEALHPLRRIYHHDYFALREVSFDIKKGETVGIVGQNGSGKSTLLKIITGVLTPSSGTVTINGRVSALLELGAGFNPELSGIENVYFSGILMGYTREAMDERLDEILAFADIGEFVYQPVKSYSSGMFTRLAFAVQSIVDPEILIIDEALSVGDSKFQAKCFNRLATLKDSGVTIILVSHSKEQIITHCTKAILLNAGEKILEGIPKDVTNKYIDLLFGKKTPNDSVPDGEIQTSKTDYSQDIRSKLMFDHDNFPNRVGYNSSEFRWGDNGALLSDYMIMSDGLEFPAIFYCWSKVKIILAVRFNAEISNPIFGIAIKNKEGVTFYNTNSENLHCTSVKNVYTSGELETISFEFVCNLFPGDYFVSLGIASRDTDGDVIPHDRRFDVIHINVASAEQPNYNGLYDFRLVMNTCADIFCEEV